MLTVSLDLRDKISRRAEGMERNPVIFTMPTPEGGE
jgi:hypothetical protein